MVYGAPMQVRAALIEGERQLPRRAGIPNPRREALWLLAHAWGRPEVRVRLEPNVEVPGEVLSRFSQWVRRRAAGEPAHHLSGSCPFWGRSFTVSPAVLIPRPETELLVEAALALPMPDQPRVLDIGTGSGCIALTLALERPGWSVAACDYSLAAATIARSNARRLATPVPLVQADLGSCFAPGFDLVTANLPYIPSDDLDDLPLEVHHDPRLALDGGDDGLELIRVLLGDLPRLLSLTGLALLEIGEDQAELLQLQALHHGLELVDNVKDLGDCNRVVTLARQS